MQNKIDIIEEYAKQFCRRHRDREFNSMCDDCCDAYQVFLEYRRDAIFEVAEELRNLNSDCDCVLDVEEMADGRD